MRLNDKNRMEEEQEEAKDEKQSDNQYETI